MYYPIAHCLSCYAVQPSRYPTHYLITGSPLYIPFTYSLTLCITTFLACHIALQFLDWITPYLVPLNIWLYTPSYLVYGPWLVH